MVYLTVILIASAITIFANGLFLLETFDGNVCNIVFCVAASVVLAIVIDSAFATVIRWILPKKWFSENKSGFAAGIKERRFYEKIGIKKWKDKVIELGAFTGFRKNKIADPTNNAYIARYITEANYGIVVHIACVFCGYLVCLAFPAHFYSVGVPVGAVNMVLNALPLMILRYNLPKLHTLYRINLKREKQNAKLRAENSVQPEKERSLIA